MTYLEQAQHHVGEAMAALRLHLKTRETADHQSRITDPHVHPSPAECQAARAAGQKLWNDTSISFGPFLRD